MLRFERASPDFVLSCRGACPHAHCEDLRLRTAATTPVTGLKDTFFIVGPTAVGKSELAADVAGNLDAEIVSADAFQIYGGLDLLTAKPDAPTLAKFPHHLIGTVSV